MSATDLAAPARELVPPGRGVLPADESKAVVTQQAPVAGIESTDDRRSQARGLVESDRGTELQNSEGDEAIAVHGSSTVKLRTGSEDRCEHSINGKASQATSSRRAFVIMPFTREDLQIVFEDFVKPTMESVCRRGCIRGDETRGAGVIIDEVSTAIRGSDIVVADLTGQNPNVLYEVGLSDAFGKATILLSQSIEDVPFDLRHRRVLLYEYSPRGCKRLERLLRERVRDMLQRVWPEQV